MVTSSPSHGCPSWPGRSLHLVPTSLCSNEERSKGGEASREYSDVCFEELKEQSPDQVVLFSVFDSDYTDQSNNNQPDIHTENCADAEFLFDAQTDVPKH